MQFDLIGRKILITAGAAGIGREMALMYLRSGAMLIKIFVCADALNALKKEAPEIITDVCDVSKKDDIERMVKVCADKLGGIDVLINNAGISGPTTPVENFTPEDWEKVINVDLNGTFNVTRLAIPFLKKSSAGVITNMSSVAGKFGYPNRSAYSAVKWGIIGFTKTLSIELGEHGIRANAILPGAVDGPRIQKVFEGRAQASGKSLDEVKNSAMSAQSIKRLVDPRDIAALAVFLASDYAKSISGQAISIDNDMQQTQ